MGAGGVEFEIRRCPGQLLFDGIEFSGDILEVAAPDTMDLTAALLGRDDFFKLLQVTFDWTSEHPRFHAGTGKTDEDPI